MCVRVCHDAYDDMKPMLEATSGGSKCVRADGAGGGGARKSGSRTSSLLQVVARVGCVAV